MGFDLVEKSPIEELGITIHIYRHKNTGLEFAHLENKDENKLFLISFLTPPYDSSGLPHILEHLVLCGSKRFPLKEPFRELMKGTLNTFLNAFTYPDRTVYPVASYHQKDLLNLVEVYLDAVFDPLLSKYSFYQEAWHIDPERERAQGVVYNEMKGAYSSPEHVLATLSLMNLYPGHPYWYDSGGRPQEILGLEYEKVLEFHKRCYCPQNAKAILYGSTDVEPIFGLLEQYLWEREPGQPLPIPHHHGLYTPQRQEDTYVPKEGQSKALVSLSWGLGEVTDLEEYLLMAVLEEALLGSPGAPLRKRIVESGLGEDLVAEGLEKELKYLSFHVGLKGVELDEAERFHPFVFETLGELAQEGIPHEFIEAGLNRVEFRLREGSDGWAKALNLSLRALNGWIYGGHPKIFLSFLDPLKRLKRRLTSQPSFVKEVLERFFLSNTKRALILLRPDPQRSRMLEEEEKARVRSLLEENRGFWEAEYRRFVSFMNTQEREEDRAAIPRLRMKELPPSPRKVAFERGSLGGAHVLIHPMDTGGVFYVDLFLDTSFVAETDPVFLPLLGRCLLEMHTKRWSMEELSSRIGRVTGGFYPESVYFHTLEGESRRFLVFRAKALNSKADSFLELMREIFLEREGWEKERFREILREEIAKVEERLVVRGHDFMVKRALSHFGEAFLFGEAVSGIQYLRSLRRLRDGLEADWSKVKEGLNFIYSMLLNQKGLVLNLTCDPAATDSIRALLEDFVFSLPIKGEMAPGTLGIKERLSEGLGVPSQVYYVGFGVQLDPSSFCGSWLSAIKYLKTNYLWEEVRMKAGAYGASVGVDRAKGVLWFSSYRDPNPKNSIQCFMKAGDMLSFGAIGADELERLIIGAIGDLDRHMEPGERGYVNTIRTLKGEDWERQLRVWEELLATGPGEIRKFGDVLKDHLPHGVVKVMGPMEGLRDLNLVSIERIL